MNLRHIDGERRRRRRISSLSHLSPAPYACLIHSAIEALWLMCTFVCGKWVSGCAPSVLHSFRPDLPTSLCLCLCLSLSLSLSVCLSVSLSLPPPPPTPFFLSLARSLSPSCSLLPLLDKGISARGLIKQIIVSLRSKIRLRMLFPLWFNPRNVLHPRCIYYSSMSHLIVVPCIRPRRSCTMCHVCVSRVRVTCVCHVSV